MISVSTFVLLPLRLSSSLEPSPSLQVRHPRLSSGHLQWSLYLLCRYWRRQIRPSVPASQQFSTSPSPKLSACTHCMLPFVISRLPSYLLHCVAFGRSHGLSLVRRCDDEMIGSWGFSVFLVVQLSKVLKDCDSDM